MKRVHVWVTGTVQGVWFRESTRREAESYNVRGWVRNLPDGRVEAAFEGEDFAVDTLVRWCHRGPDRASVRHVDAVEEPVVGDEAFQVLR